MELKMNEEIFIGREKELRAIQQAMDQKRNLIIFGEEGVGKTALIQKIRKEREADFILFSVSSLNLKESLLNLILSSRHSQRELNGKNILALKKIFYGLLEKKPSYIIFDHLARVGPRFYSFFEFLIDKEIPLVILSRGLTKDDIGHLWMSLFSFEKIKIENLTQHEAGMLVNRYIELFNIPLTNKDDFKRSIFYFSKGNPKVIRTLCSLARDTKYSAKGFTDAKLINLDRRIKEAVR